MSHHSYCFVWYRPGEGEHRLLPPLRLPDEHSSDPLTAVTFSSLWGRLFTRKETKVLILGLDNAGKVRTDSLQSPVPSALR